MKITKQRLKEIIKEELGSVLKEFDEPDQDYKDKRAYLQTHGVPSAAAIAQKKRAAEHGESRKRSNEIHLDWVAWHKHLGPPAENLYQEIQDYIYDNDYEIPDDLVDKYVGMFPEELQQTARYSVTDHH